MPTASNNAALVVEKKQASVVPRTTYSPAPDLAETVYPTPTDAPNLAGDHTKVKVSSAVALLTVTALCGAMTGSADPTVISSGSWLQAAASESNAAADKIYFRIFMILSVF